MENKTKPRIISIISFFVILFYLMGHIISLDPIKILGVSIILGIIIYVISYTIINKKLPKLK